ncbi:MAG TPA: FliH/SctL family protein [Burkholderiaceae bacterium]|nr:FliH/SctL family protein [Burkholderiaceae bacterium]
MGARFIPKEELPGFAAWKFDSLSGSPGRSTAGKVSPSSLQPQAATPQSSETDSAFAAGRAEGMKAGLAMGFEKGWSQAKAEDAVQQDAQMQALAQQVGRIAERFASGLEHLETQAASSLIDLAIEIARQVVRVELQMHPESITAVVDEALRTLIDSVNKPTVWVSPHDMERIGRHLAAELDARSMLLKADPALSPGECRVSTPNATVDATLAARWRRALAAIGRQPDGSEETWHADPAEGGAA